MVDNDDLLTPIELAKQLKVQLSWVYNQTRPGYEGNIPCVRVGKYLRFRLADVIAWLDKGDEI